MKTKIINSPLLDQVSQEANKTPRKRKNYNFHQSEDRVQRFLNAIESNSYIRPHRHINPLNDEIFLVLKGRGAIFIFDENGSIQEVYELNPETGNFGVDIPGGVLHTIVSLEDGSVFYEVKEGPYNPAAAKHFCEWAPEEDTPEAAEYLTYLKQEAEKILCR